MMENVPVPAPQRWVVKLGGSLLATPQWTDRFRTWQQSSGIPAADVVVGGGRSVNALRERARKESWDDSLAHWRAIEAMDENAQHVAGLAGLSLFEPVAESGSARIIAASAQESTQWRIVKLSRLLRHRDPLPHTWDITSDSISAWWARQITAVGLVLLKSRPASPGWDPRHDDDQGLVDPCFGQLLPVGIEIRVIARWDSPSVANLRAPMPRV